MTRPGYFKLAYYVTHPRPRNVGTSTFAPGTWRPENACWQHGKPCTHEEAFDGLQDIGAAHIAAAAPETDAVADAAATPVPIWLLLPMAH